MSDTELVKISDALNKDPTYQRLASRTHNLKDYSVEMKRDGEVKGLKEHTKRGLVDPRSAKSEVPVEHF